MTDILADALEGIRTVEAVSAGLSASGDWALSFAPPPGVKFNAIRYGRAWLRVGDLAPVRLDEGDCALLTHRLPFVLSSDPDRPPEPAAHYYPTAAHGIARVNGGGPFLLLGGRFTFETERAHRLFAALPPLIVVRRGDGTGLIAAALESLAVETREARPGARLVAESLGRALLALALRQHLAEAGPERRGWLYALADPRLAPALEAIHSAPGRGWRLDELAARAGLSRSAFAARFRDRVDQSPAAYVAEWRMTVASERLRAAGGTVAAVAHEMGYDSESAFSNAFRRARGISPGAWRRGAAA